MPHLSTKPSAAVLLLLISVLTPSCQKLGKPLIEQALQAKAAGKLLDAEILLRKAIDKDASASEAHYQLSLLYLQMGKVPDALKSGRIAAQSTTQKFRYSLHNAEVALAAYTSSPTAYPDSLREATQILEDLSKSQPKDLELTRLRGMVALTMNDPATALQILDSVPGVASSPSRQLVRMQALFQADRRADAIKEGFTLLDRHPEFDPAYDVMARYLKVERKTAELERLLVQRLRESRNKTAAVLALAEHHASRSDNAAFDTTIQAILANPKVYPDAYLLAGDIYSRYHQFGKAQAAYSAGLKIEPARQSIYVKRMANLSVAGGDAKQALNLVEGLLKQQPADLDSRSVRAKLWLDSGEPELRAKALVELEELAEKLKGDAGIQYNLGRAYFLKGDLPKARARFESSLRAGPTSMLPRYALTEILLIQQRWDDADAAAQALLRLDPKNAVARLTQVSVLTARKRFDPAHRLLQELIDANPDFIPAKLQMGQLLMAEGKFAKAAEWFSGLRARGIRPHETSSWQANALFANQQKQEALKVLELQIAVGKADASTYVLAAITSEYLGKTDAALGFYQKASSLNPIEATPYLGMARIHQRLGNSGDAQRALANAASKSNRKTEALAELAFLQESEGSVDQAIHNYRELLKIDPKHGVAHNNIAVLLCDRSASLDEAEQHARRAVELDSKSDGFRDTLAMVYIRKKNGVEAMNILRGLVDRSPEQADFQFTSDRHTRSWAPNNKP